MAPQGRTVEQELARLAGAAHGVVTRAKLLSVGITPAEIRTRTDDGGLLRVHRGVYRVGHLAPSLPARYLAAVWACAPGALLCGRAAGYLLEILRGSPPAPEVLTLTERRIRGVRTRRARHGIDEEDRSTWRAIPVTTVARTLVDLAGVLSLGALARACHEAGIRHLTTPADVARVLARCSNAPGRANLELVLGRRVAVTLSVLERRFHARLREAGLRRPDESNRHTGSYRVDCRWLDPPLTVELDGYRFHNSRHAWQQDRRREREAYARGDQFRRYTYHDVIEDPRPMLAELSALLA